MVCESFFLFFVVDCIMRTTSYKAPTFLEEHNLDTVYDAINCVASVPWKVNTKVSYD